MMDLRPEKISQHLDILNVNNECKFDMQWNRQFEKNASEFFSEILLFDIKYHLRPICEQYGLVLNQRIVFLFIQIFTFTPFMSRLMMKSRK